MKETFNDLLKVMEKEFYNNLGKPTPLFDKCFELIINKNNAEYAYRLARKNWRDIDVDTLQDIVINSNHYGYMLLFACDVEKADKEKLARIISSKKLSRADQINSNLIFDDENHDILSLMNFANGLEDFDLDTFRQNVLDLYNYRNFEQTLTDSLNDNNVDLT